MHITLLSSMSECLQRSLAWWNSSTETLPHCFSTFFSSLIRFSPRCQNQVSDHLIGLFLFYPQTPFETRIVSPSWPPSHFPSCCCWQPFGPYWCKWALATHCVPAWTAHFGFQVASQGTSAIPTVLRYDINLKIRFAQGCIYFPMHDASLWCCWIY